MAGFSNRKRLSAKMKAIPVEVRRALRAQNAANAEELVQTMKGFVPVDEMKLHDSIKRQDVSNSARISQRVSAGSRSAPYASWVEHGTSKNDAKPFFWPSWRLKRKRLKGRMTRAAKKAIAGAVK